MCALIVVRNIDALRPFRIQERPRAARRSLELKESRKGISVPSAPRKKNEWGGGKRLPRRGGRGALVAVYPALRPDQKQKATKEAKNLSGPASLPSLPSVKSPWPRS